MFGRGITDANALIKRTLSAVRDAMQDDGLGILYNEYIPPETGSLRIATTRDSRVVGSVTELIKTAQMYLTDYEWSPYRTACKLNETILSYNDYREPRDVFRGLVDRVAENVEPPDNE